MAPGALAASPPRVKPPRLRAGDTVGLVAPASAVTLPYELDRALHWVRGMGLVPRQGANLGEQFGYLAGQDAQRAEDINAMFADPDVRAIFAVRGGWGGARVLERLDWDAIRAHPKLVIGYSDTTALHFAIATRAGYPSLHAPNAASRWEAASWESLWRIAFAGEAVTLGGDKLEAEVGRPGQTLVPGIARGRLIGGNLTILSTLMGTPWLPSMDGAILFLEDINEEPYRIDRMLQQLKLAGVFDMVSGVVFGQCTRCASRDPEYRGFSVEDVLAQHLGELGKPVITGFNTGHVRNQLVLPVKTRVELDAGARTLRMLEPAVA
ncbi:LD-carboxypeptidase [Qipengyuania flava]|nr:LD-carboxypeptidase [Qipengyuania flava]